MFIELSASMVSHLSLLLRIYTHCLIEQSFSFFSHFRTLSISWNFFAQISVTSVVYSLSFLHFSFVSAGWFTLLMPTQLCLGHVEAQSQKLLQDLLQEQQEPKYLKINESIQWTLTGRWIRTKKKLVPGSWGLKAHTWIRNVIKPTGSLICYTTMPALIISYFSTIFKSFLLSGMTGSKQ